MSDSGNSTIEFDVNDVRRMLPDDSLTGIFNKIVWSLVNQTNSGGYTVSLPFLVVAHGKVESIDRKKGVLDLSIDVKEIPNMSWTNSYEFSVAVASTLRSMEIVTPLAVFTTGEKWFDELPFGTELSEMERMAEYENRNRNLVIRGCTADRRCVNTEIEIEVADDRTIAAIPPTIEETIIEDNSGRPEVNAAEAFFSVYFDKE